VLSSLNVAKVIVRILASRSQFVTCYLLTVVIVRIAGISVVIIIIYIIGIVRIIVRLLDVILDAREIFVALAVLLLNHVIKESVVI
jgi:hypothetical protein